MASKAKYTPAPQTDPDETAAFSAPPPSYQAEASSSAAPAASQDAGIFGVPRSSEDNLPDDFKVRKRKKKPPSRTKARL